MSLSVCVCGLVVVYAMLNILSYSPVSFGHSIGRLLLCRGERSPPNRVQDMRPSYLMVRLQSQSFVIRSTAPYLCSNVNFDPMWSHI